MVDEGWEPFCGLGAGGWSARDRSRTVEGRAISMSDWVLIEKEEQGLPLVGSLLEVDASTCIAGIWKVACLHGTYAVLSWDGTLFRLNGLWFWCAAIGNIGVRVRPIKNPCAELLNHDKVRCDYCMGSGVLRHVNPAFADEPCPRCSHD